MACPEESDANLRPHRAPVRHWGSDPSRHGTSLLPWWEAPAKGTSPHPQCTGLHEILVTGCALRAFMSSSNLRRTPGLFFRCVPGHPIALLQLADEVFRVAVGNLQIIVGEFAPAGLQFAVELLPLGLDPVFVMDSSVDFRFYNSRHVSRIRIRSIEKPEFGLELVNLAPSLETIDVIAFLQYADEVADIAVIVHQIVFGEPRPLLAKDSAELRPM